MYKRALSLLVTGSFLFMASFLCVKSIDKIQVCSEPVQMLKLELEQLEEKAKAMEERAILEARQDPGNPEKGLGILDIAVSGQRVVDYGMIEHTLAYDLPDEELDALGDSVADLEDAVFDDEDEQDEFLGDLDGMDEDFFEIPCPTCGEDLVVDDEVLSAGVVDCPACGGKFALSFEDDKDGPEDEE